VTEVQLPVEIERAGEIAFPETDFDHRAMRWTFPQGGGMLQDGAVKWPGSTVGVLLGLAVAGGLAASPDYIASPVLGIGAGAVAAVIGFGIDRRRMRAARAARWAASFADGPADTMNRLDSFVRRLEPQNSVVDFEHKRFREVKPIREWCRGRTAEPVWLLAGDPGSGKTRLAMQVAAAVRALEIEPYVCGWPNGQGVSVALEADRPVLIIVDDAEVRHPSSRRWRKP
jgi:hypothetical protein